MTDDRPLANMKALIGLARSNGVDVRGTLLRVLVDQFVLQPFHSPAETTRFAELCLRLLERAEPAERARVAEIVKDRADLPLSVARRLIADHADVARPLLIRSPVVTDADQLAAVLSGDVEKAVAVAERRDIAIAALNALETSPAPPVKAALARRLARRPPGRTPLVAPPLAALDGDGAAARYLKAAGPERAAIVARLAELVPDEVDDVLAALRRDPDGARKVELAALSRRPERLAETLSAALHLPAPIAVRIVADDGGEPLVVACKALDMGRDAAIRVLLFAQETIGRSFDQVKRLADLYDATPAVAVLALLAGWRKAAPAATRVGKHMPVLSPDPPAGTREASHPAARATRALDQALRPDVARKA